MRPRLGVALASVLVVVLAALARPRLVPSPDLPPPRAMADALELRTEPLSVEKHLILGCSPLAGIYGSIPESQAFDTVKTALELGFRDFDTAPHYGLGLSERRLGAALEKHAGETRDVRSLEQSRPRDEGGGGHRARSRGGERGGGEHARSPRVYLP